MRWKGREQSENVEDRRGMPAGRAAGLGGFGIVVALVVFLLTGDPSALFGAAAGGAPGAAVPAAPPSAHEQELREFVGVTLRDTEVVWDKLFQSMGRRYESPKLVLFSGRVDSACGMASAAAGPFYCAPDQDVYLDLSFYETMRDQFGAGGDFAMAYVVAHEVGHHVQNLLGTMDKVNQRRSRMNERDANALSVRLELQADYYAGVWAHHARSMAELDRTDIQEAITAANAIGDDTLQKQAQGYVVPDAFTHGTSEQRVRWFMKGFESGDPRGGDTFSVRNL
ncbi:MAG: neutral zinc metallopeptidase [Fimbriimonadaceae bacterium]|nr:neutral zinc metallopeptidase [Fimbriimonadaceae bacterium]QYK54748.1 MAG: neutral zinc metallopeptidase [Fimbriimonadaceae bacterium]